jgi:glycosyltransferase involved in cell wall biosynthesis
MLDCIMTNTVFHTPFQSVPQEVRRTSLEAVVVTVHDMLPRIHPEYFTSESIRQFNILLEQLLPSDHVICVSESTKQDFLRCHRSTPAEQVHVTPLAAAPELRPVEDQAAISALRRKLGLDPHDQVVLSLCTLEPRKNLTTLIIAFEQLWHRCDGSSLKLVLAGSLGWKTTALTEQLRTSPAAEAIVVSGYVPDDQLACLYSLADAFVYPSVYEGFGLPPLEAMQCGTPVIVGKTSSLPEVVGDAAVLVDPRSPAELEVALADLLGSAERRRALRQAGLAQAALFSWSSTAQHTAAIYRAILGSHG